MNGKNGCPIGQRKTLDVCVKTKDRTLKGTLGGISKFTDVYIYGDLRGSILETTDLQGKKRFMATTKHNPYRGKYSRKKQTAINHIVREEKKFIPISKLGEIYV